MRSSDSSDEDAEWRRVHSWTQSALDQLSREPESDFEKRRNEVVHEDLLQAAPIVEELRDIGIPLWEIGELGNVRFAYPAAVPILVKHLACDLRDGVALALVHALTKPYGPSALNAVREFLERRANALSRSDLFAVGNALAANLKRSDIATALELIKNPAYSLAREPIALRTARWRSDEVVSALREYLRGGESPWTAIRALRLAKAWSAADEVRPYAASESAEVRNEAKKYAEAAAKASK